MPERNPDLFREVGARIAAEPKLYNQKRYSRSTDCGTAYCIAGWVGQVLIEQSPQVYSRAKGDHDSIVIKTGRNRSIKHVGVIAAEELGLNEEEASILFDSLWEPAEGLTVEEALVKIGNGADISEML